MKDWDFLPDRAGCLIWVFSIMLVTILILFYYINNDGRLGP